MPVEIDGRTYYRTAEVCQIVGIGKSTLFRWIKENIVQDAEYRDRKGWRLFAEDELHSLEAETKRVQKNHGGSDLRDSISIVA
ncbi:MAG: MerR family transcriptional regulator [Dehalococcoidia bacterium]